MKNFIITAILLTFCAISAQAQTPTLQQIIDKVGQNFHAIDSLHVYYTMELYVPSVGLEPPDSLSGCIGRGELIYIYPDTRIIITSDTTLTESSMYVRTEYSKTVGNSEYERFIRIFASDGDTLIEDTGFEFEREVPEYLWHTVYMGWFRARLFFQFNNYLDQCYQAWLNGNPEQDIYIISVHEDPEMEMRKDYYINYANGTIIRVKYYDVGGMQGGTPDNPIFGGEDIYSNFQQIQGIWFPFTLEDISSASPNSEPPYQKAIKRLVTYIINIGE